MKRLYTRTISATTRRMWMRPPAILKVRPSSQKAKRITMIPQRMPPIDVLLLYLLLQVGPEFRFPACLVLYGVHEAEEEKVYKWSDKVRCSLVLCASGWMPYPCFSALQASSQ